MTAQWRKVSEYAVTNGAQSISLKSGTFCLHEGNAYTKHGEDECEVVVAATYPDAESMKSYLATGGLSDPKICNLHGECRTAWGRRGAEEAKWATSKEAMEAADRVRGEKVAA